MSRPRVGIDARYACMARPAGIGVYERNLLAGLSRLDPSFDLDLYLDATSDLDVARTLTRGAVHRLTFPFSSLWTQVRLPLALRSSRPDLFFFVAHSVPVAMPMPCVVTFHDTTYRHVRLPAADRVRLEILSWHAARTARHVIAISQTTRRELIAAYDLLPERVSVTPLGCDHERFHTRHDPDDVACAAARHGIDRPYVLFVGSATPNKNLPRLVEAFALACERHGLPHALVIGGAEASGSAALDQAIARWGQAAPIHRLPYLPGADVPLLYRGAAAFAFPSLFEGFGLPVLEAMASGVPVVTSTAGSLPEVAGDAAWQVDPGDVDALAEALTQALTDRELARARIAAGLARAAEFTWDKTASLTLGILERELQALHG